MPRSLRSFVEAQEPQIFIFAARVTPTKAERTGAAFAHCATLHDA